MSWDGTMIGSPLAGERMLFVDIISIARFELGFQRQRHVTAIWSPSKSALNAVQTSGMQLDRLAFDQHRLERLDAQAVQRRGAVQQTGCSRMTSSRMSHTRLFGDARPCAWPP